MIIWLPTTKPLICLLILHWKLETLLNTANCDKSQLQYNDASYAVTAPQVSPIGNNPIAAARSSCTFESTTPSINANAAVSGSAYSPPPSCLTFRTYTGAIFTVPKTSKFFVIKSYNILDVNASFIHNIWTSTELGNRRLDKAYTELSKPITLMLTVRSFCFPGQFPG